MYYKKASYEVWLDGRGYCIGVTYFDGEDTTNEEHEASIGSYETVEELIDNYILYDGIPLAAAVEMDVKELKE